MDNVRSMHTDAELLRRSAIEPAAFGEFYDRHLAAILAFLAQRTRSTELAYDLTAEVFAAALEGAGRFRAPPDDSAAPWLHTIARNKLADLYRRRRVDDAVRRRLGLQPIELTDEGLQHLEAIIASTDTPATGALGTLAPDERAAVVARVLDEQDYHTIAARFR